MEKAREILKEVFQFDSFRLAQEQVNNTLLYQFRHWTDYRSMNQGDRTIGGAQ